ncbi:MAG: hypothetical protein QOH31_210 [Verrucomicrobiota bacterium]|jgi:GrpB-like predicted nucleotidyltransferase (UPF0157 family)
MCKRRRRNGNTGAPSIYRSQLAASMTLFVGNDGSRRKNSSKIKSIAAGEIRTGTLWTPRKNSRKKTGFQSIAVQCNLLIFDPAWKCCTHCGDHGLWPGGWAIDLFLGRETRNHQDIDIAVFREDQFELRRHLTNWKWEKAVNGTLVCWESNEWLELPIHELRANSGEYQFEFLFNERRQDLWVYRRDQTITRPIADFRPESGVPILPPEIVLLYKSKNPSEKDLADFRRLWPRLNSEARRWLADAMVRVRPVTWNAVEVVDYDERWPVDFSRIANELGAVLGELIVGIEHVGSTSVPGLAAKPMIDIDVLIRSSAQFPEIRDRLERFGYIHRGPRGIAGREVFRCVIDLPKHLLYVSEQTSRPVIEHLSFRNRLRNDPEVASAYVKLKRDLAQRFRNDRERYTEAKTDFIRRILASSQKTAG